MRFGIALVSLLIFFSACSKKETYKLKWKTPESANLVYQIQQKTYIYSESSVKDLFELRKSAENQESYLDIMLPESDKSNSGLSKYLNSMLYYTYLKKNVLKSDIKIVGISKEKLHEKNNLFSALNDLDNLTIAQGSITKSGVLKNKNADPLLAVLFQMPLAEVEIGSFWQLKLNSALTQSGFDPQTKGQNVIKFIGIREVEGNKLAKLTYEIEKRPNSSNLPEGSLMIQAKGEFNISQGRWENFSGIIIRIYSEFIDMTQVQTFNLKFIEKNIVFQKTKRPEKLVNKDKNQHNPDNSDTIIRIEECDIYYGVQIMASQKPISIDAIEFIDIRKYGITEKIGESTDKFRFKYIVGKKCKRSEAESLKKIVREKGYPGAYVVSL